MQACTISLTFSQPFLEHESESRTQNYRHIYYVHVKTGIILRLTEEKTWPANPEIRLDTLHVRGERRRSEKRKTKTRKNKQCGKKRRKRIVY